MFFSEVIGQEALKRRLAENIEKGRIPHAQLFEGKSGYGALTLALAYATYLNCENRQDGESCGICRSCRMMRTLEHPDLHFVFPSNKTKKAESLYSDGGTAKVTSDSFLRLWRETLLRTGGYLDESEWYREIGMGDTSRNTSGMIGRADAKNLIGKLTYKGIGEGYKTVVFWLPERMNLEAANTLLKEFEEPSASTVFLFVTENSPAILPTVLSRTQQTTVPPVSRESILACLHERNITGEPALALYRQCEGDLILLNRLLDEGEEAGDGTMLELFKELMGLCYRNDYARLADWCNDFARLGREESRRFFTESLRILRLCYLRGIGLQELAPLRGNERVFIEKFTPYVHRENIEPLTEAFEKAFFELKRNGNAKIVVTHFTLNLCKLIRR